MLEIQSSKLVLTLVDTETGELFTKEATFGDFKEVKKSSSTRTKKPKDDGNPVPTATLLEGKLQLNNAAVELTGFEPEMKIDIKFEKVGKKNVPVMMEAPSGNRFTKTYTISCRGSKHDNLAEFGDTFEVRAHEKKEGFFKLMGNIQKEDDIIDVPEEIANPEEVNSDDIIEDNEGIDLDNFTLDL